MDEKHLILLTITVIVLGVLIIPKAIRKAREREELNAIMVYEREELKRKQAKTQTNIDYYTAKLDNLYYVSGLVETELQAETDNKEVITLTEKLARLDEQIHQTQKKLEKELEKLNGDI